MRNPSFRYRALGELTDEELKKMLSENETLFVEHKGGLGEDGYQISSAAASFANTLGGWILVGVTDGKPNEDDQDGWTPPNHPFVDAVRELFQDNIDPIPPFAADLRKIDGQTVGVIRIYESADSPHVSGRGAIFIREVAQARNLQRSRSSDRYATRGVRNQQLLLELLRRGDQARARVDRLLSPPSQMQFLDPVLQVMWAQTAAGHWSLFTEAPCLVLRLAPLTPTPRFREWAISRHALEAMKRVAADLYRTETVLEEHIQAHPAGFAAIGRGGNGGTILDEVPGLLAVHTIAATDVAGAIGLSVKLAYTGNAATCPVTLNGIETLLRRPLRFLLGVLEAAEFHGRTACHMLLGSVGQVVSIHEDGRASALPAYLPLGGDLTVPVLVEEDSGEGSELDALCQRWRNEVARSAGLLVPG